MGSYSLVTGGAGFIGCNLADSLLSDGESVVILDSLVRPGARANAEWLERKHGNRVQLCVLDVREAEEVAKLAKDASAIFHLAAQVAVTTSLSDPREDLEVNVLGTFNVLEGARRARRPPPVLFTSTNKVYGSLSSVRVERARSGYHLAGRPEGVDEQEPLDFHSPYGCSKGAADQYVRDYARIFGLPTVVFRMSCIYGEHQMGTEDQGWVAHFARAVLGGESITLYGDGYQVRDLLWVGDLVRAMRAAVARAEEHPGEVFNMGGGAANVLSVRDAVDRIIALTGSKVPVRLSDWRPGDQRAYVSNIGKAREQLGWAPQIDVNAGLERLVRWLSAEARTPFGERPRSPLEKRRPRSQVRAAGNVA